MCKHPLKYILFLSFILVSQILSSCGKEKSISPKINFTPDRICCFPGDTISINGYIVKESYSKALFQHLTIFITCNGKTSVLKDSSFKATDYVMSQSRYIIPKGTTENTIYTVVVTDNLGSSFRYSGDLIVTFWWFQTQLGGQDNLKISGLSNAVSGRRFRADSAKSYPELIDFCYFYDTTLKACLSSPDNPYLSKINYSGTSPSSWKARNHTTFRFLPQMTDYPDFFFNIHSASELKDLYETGINESSYIAPENPKSSFFSFRTSSNKYGLVSIDPKVRGANGMVEISGMVQR